VDYFGTPKYKVRHTEYSSGRILAPATRAPQPVIFPFRHRFPFRPKHSLRD
jgi:hypothetical protein